MIKEGAYTQEQPEESIERNDGFSEETLKRILESRNHISDFGKSGILFRVGPEDLSPEDQATIALAEGGNTENPEGAVSIKALKVYDIALAQKEFESLQKARDILMEHKDPSIPVTRIPRAFGFHKIKVDRATQDLLNANGGSIHDGKVGIIVMDWIEGKDIATALKEELLRLTPEEKDEDTYLGQGKDLKNGNFAELLHLLEKKGFVLPQAIVTQINNTVEILHKKNFYHNDLHLRNLILKDGDFEDPQTYMIDFADAGNEEVTIENAQGAYALSDKNIIRALTPLTKTIEEKQKEHDNVIKKEWEERVAIAEKNPKALEQYKSIQKALKASDILALDNQFATSSGSNTDLDNFFANLLHLSREDISYRDDIERFLESFLDVNKAKTKSHYVTNRIHALLKEIRT